MNILSNIFMPVFLQDIFLTELLGQKGMTILDFSLLKLPFSTRSRDTLAAMIMPSTQILGF